MTLLVGYKEIGKALNNASKSTVKRWRKKHGFPIKFVGTTPTAEEAAIKKWWDEFLEKRLGRI